MVGDSSVHVEIRYLAQVVNGSSSDSFYDREVYSKIITIFGTIDVSKDMWRYLGPMFNKDRVGWSVYDRFVEIDVPNFEQLGVSGSGVRFEHGEDSRVLHTVVTLEMKRRPSKTQLSKLVSQTTSLVSRFYGPDGLYLPDGEIGAGDVDAYVFPVHLKQKRPLPVNVKE